MGWTPVVTGARLTSIGHSNYWTNKTGHLEVAATTELSGDPTEPAQKHSSRPSAIIGLVTHAAGSHTAVPPERRSFPRRTTSPAHFRTALSTHGARMPRYQVALWHAPRHARRCRPRWLYRGNPRSHQAVRRRTHGHHHRRPRALPYPGALFRRSAARGHHRLPRRSRFRPRSSKARATHRSLRDLPHLALRRSSPGLLRRPEALAFLRHRRRTSHRFALETADPRAAF